MIPHFFLARLNHRYNTMTCDKPCDDCKCDKPCDCLPVDADLYVEIDDGTFADCDQYTLIPRR